MYVRNGSFVMMGSLSLFLLFYSFSTVWVTYLHADFDFFIFSFGSVGRDLTEMNGFFFFHVLVSNISVYLCCG